MTRPPLTLKRRNWAKTRGHDGIMRGKRLALPVGVAARYASKLQALTDEMTATTQKEVEALFKHPDVQAHFAMDISPASQARILTNKLKAHFEQLFNSKSQMLANGMASQVDSVSKTNVYASLKELSGGLSLKTDFLTGTMKEFLKGTIAENVSLIKSIPSEYMRKVQGAVLRSITVGKGLPDLQAFFEDQLGVESRRAKNIAIDQTHKAYAGLNTGRMKAAGIKKFEWVHSGGGLHPRPIHEALSGKICSFAKLPIIDDDGTRGIPGQLINCRCTQVPVIQFEDGEPEE